MSKSENNISKICTSCGFCCDGTLFGFAKANNEKDTESIKRLGLTKVEKNGKSLIQLPCRHFEKKCTVYDQSRPEICGKFFCEPIKKLKKGNYTEKELQELIESTKRLRKQFLEEINNNHPEFNNMSMTSVIKSLNASKKDNPKSSILKYAQLFLIARKLTPRLQEFSKK
jgi:Fe-S-cluster containining protein